MKINNARTAAKPDERIGELAQKAGEQIDGARDKFNANVDNIDRKVEEKAAEAKGGLSLVRVVWWRKIAGFTLDSVLWTDTLYKYSVFSLNLVL